MPHKKHFGKRKRFKKRYAAIPLLLLGILAASILDVDIKAAVRTIIDVEALFAQEQQNINSYVLDEGTIALYFCPHEDCETALLEFLNSAEQSIHCALFDIGLESVQQMLLEKSEAIEVLAVTDNNYLEKFSYPFVRSDSYGLMHNKFCIIDGEKVSTGSMNPTFNGAHKNNNNLLFIESGVLAQNYEDEFQEMWGGTFKRGERVKNPDVKIGDTLMHNYFCPEDLCAERIKEELKKAQGSIYFMAFSFTHDGIANVMLLKRLDGIKIKGVMETRQVNEHSVFNLLQYQLGEENILKDKNPQNMHHKVFIIDEKTVITGSMNPTGGGDERNDENVLIIEDEGIARRFVDEFWKVYGESNPISE